ncbi:hypothetical protein [Streptomyces sp. DSM 40484]|uniref:hypothetical protein n=1 Tax=Streptomyces kroppenstedtii TaxID=3051181 RepID=UPI0028D0C5B5|nr:hypothetical protein [Streptomyces sp. DSM 40484]
MVVWERWDRAVEATVRLLAARPAPEGARPVERAADLQQQTRAALSPALAAANVEQDLPAGVERVGGNRELLASWLRAGDWYPILPIRCWI